MGAHDGLPPIGGFPTLRDRAERAFEAFGRKNRQLYRAAHQVPTVYGDEEDDYFNRPMRWRRRATHRKYMDELTQLSPLERAAHGIAVKMLRMAMVQYRQGATPMAFRAIVDENQSTLYGVDPKEFAEHVEHFSNRLLSHGCTATVNFGSESGALIMEIHVSREPRFISPPPEYFTLDLV